MHQLLVPALVLLCASSVSVLSLTPTRPAAAASEAFVDALATPRADSTAAPAAPHVIAATKALPLTEFEKDVSRVLSQLQGRHTRLSRRDLIQLAETIVEQADRHGLDATLVLAVIEVESGYYNLAVSHVGALGLMQLMPATARELAHKHGVAWSGEESLFDPIVNVKLGIAYLSQLSDRYDGNVRIALAAYNWGPGRIDGFLRRGAPVPTGYSRRVMQSYSPERHAL